MSLTLVSGIVTKAKNAIQMDTIENPIIPAAVSYPVANQIFNKKALSNALAAWQAVVREEALPRARKGNSSAGTTQLINPIEKAYEKENRQRKAPKINRMIYEGK